MPFPAECKTYVLFFPTEKLDYHKSHLNLHLENLTDQVDIFQHTASPCTLINFVVVCTCSYF